MCSCPCSLTLHSPLSLLGILCVCVVLFWDSVVPLLQGGHGTGKTGNLDIDFSRQGKHRKFRYFNFYTVKIVATQGKFWVSCWCVCVCVLSVYDVWGIYSWEYISQLYVRGRPHVHLIYHPVDVLKWATWAWRGPTGGGGGIPFSILGMYPNPECSREVCKL